MAAQPECAAGSRNCQRPRSKSGSRASPSSKHGSTCRAFTATRGNTSGSTMSTAISEAGCRNREWENGRQGDKGTFLSNTPVFRMISHRYEHGDGDKRLLINLKLRMPRDFLLFLI